MITFMGIYTDFCENSLALTTANLLTSQLHCSVKMLKTKCSCICYLYIVFFCCYYFFYIIVFVFVSICNSS